MTPPDIASVRRPAADAVVIGLRLPAGAAAFAGHFPGYPILPGVLQIDWALRLANDHLGLIQPAARDFQIKFRQAILPGADVSLRLVLDRARRRLDLEYRVGEEIASTGRIALE